MARTTKTADELLRDLSKKLGLAYEPQDWGVMNADGARLDEFVSFFRQENLRPTQEFEMAGLILASANERLLDGLDVEIEDLIVLAEQHAEAFSHHVEYWSGLKNDGEFPLSNVLLRARNP